MTQIKSTALIISDAELQELSTLTAEQVAEMKIFTTFSSKRRYIGARVSYIVEKENLPLLTAIKLEKDSEEAEQMWEIIALSIDINRFYLMDKFSHSTDAPTETPDTPTEPEPEEPTDPEDQPGEGE